MRWPRIAACVLAFLGLLNSVTRAEMRLPVQVLSSGGGLAVDAQYKYFSTTGQPSVGTTSDFGRVHEIGFWFVCPASIASPVDLTTAVPTVFDLGTVQPNPLQENGTLHFAVPSPSHVTIRLYDVAGRIVRTLLDGQAEPGFHEVHLSSLGLPSGVYFCRMQAEGFAKTRRLVLMR